MAKRLVRGALLLGLVVSVARCGDDAGKKVVDDSDGGQGGETTASGGSGEPGDAAGAPTIAGSGGVPGNEAGAPASSGAGGVPAGSSGAPAMTEGGGSGESATGAGGAGGGGSCVPTDCCSGDEPTCDSAWDTDCGSGQYHSCCDPNTGVSKSCSYGGGGVDRYASVCVNDCTGKSYGTSACGCLSQNDPPCDGDWLDSCGSSITYCSDSVAGYRLSCVDVDPNSRTVDVACVCDPEVQISGRRR